MSRSALLLSAAVVSISVLGASFARTAPASDTPAGVVVRSMAKAAEYDRHFAAKVQGGKAHVAVVFNAGEPSSQAAAFAAIAQLEIVEKIAGFAHDQESWPYVGAEALAAAVHSKNLSVVVVSSGLANEAPAIAHALDGIAVLTVALDSADVARGVVFGLDHASGSSKMVIDLAQARRQDVVFEASLLTLAHVL